MGVDQVVPVRVDADVGLLIRVVGRLLELRLRGEPLAADVHLERGVPVVAGFVGGRVGRARRTAPGAVASAADQEHRDDADHDEDRDRDVPPERPTTLPLGLAVAGAHRSALVAGPGLGHGEWQVTR